MKTFEVSGVTINAVDRAQALGMVRRWFSAPGDPRVIFTPNPEILWHAQRDPRVRSALRKGSLLVPDGVGVVIAGRLRGISDVRRLTGIDLAEAICRQLHPRIYLLGAREGVAERAARTLEGWGATVVGCHHGFFEAEEVRGILEGVRKAGTQLLLVALGSPRQEIFIDSHLADLGVPVAMAVGGSFDVWAGDKRRAPVVVRRLGLEWLWRTAMEPSRLTRLWPLVVFFWGMAFDRQRR